MFPHVPQGVEHLLADGTARQALVQLSVSVKRLQASVGPNALIAAVTTCNEHIPTIETANAKAYIDWKV